MKCNFVPEYMLTLQHQRACMQVELSCSGECAVLQDRLTIMLTSASANVYTEDLNLLLGYIANAKKFTLIRSTVVPF